MKRVNPSFAPSSKSASASSAQVDHGPPAKQPAADLSAAVADRAAHLHRELGGETASASWTASFYEAPDHRAALRRARFGATTSNAAFPRASVRSTCSAGSSERVEDDAAIHGRNRSEGSGSCPKRFSAPARRQSALAYSSPAGHDVPMAMPRLDGKVLITGASGFIGSRLRDELLASGSDVVAIRRPGSPAASRRPLGTGGLRESPPTWRAIVRSEEPDYVLHVAGVTKGTAYEDFQPWQRDAHPQLAGGGSRRASRNQAFRHGVIVYVVRTVRDVCSATRGESASADRALRAKQARGRKGGRTRVR